MELSTLPPIQDNKWVGEVAIPKDISKVVEFKFLVSQWDITPESYKEWEDGYNRVIEPKSLHMQSYYSNGRIMQLLSGIARILLYACELTRNPTTIMPTMSQAAYMSWGNGNKRKVCSQLREG